MSIQEMYWYIAKDERGKRGMVPGNFLKPLKGIFMYVMFMCMVYAESTSCHSVELC